MEKKQAIILLILILAVSLISFSLGVMVGRGGGDKPAIKAVPQVIPPRPTALASELQKPASENVPGQLLVAPQSDNAAETMAAPDKPADNLTFYETLPRGDQPLGSGINLPPASADTGNEAPAQDGDMAEKGQPAATRAAEKTVTAKAPVAERHAAAESGSYVVQLASFKDAAAAAKLERRLAAKGYQMFVEPADLGNRGIWHRVYAGPYADKPAAEQVAGRLQHQEKISPLVRKR
jgi:cell division septation protein DedD